MIKTSTDPEVLRSFLHIQPNIFVEHTQEYTNQCAHDQTILQMYKAALSLSATNAPRYNDNQDLLFDFVY